MNIQVPFEDTEIPFGERPQCLCDKEDIVAFYCAIRDYPNFREQITMAELNRRSHFVCRCRGKRY